MPKIKKETTICLMMIVKNESKVIERCLSSVKDIIDYWVISDTGSTDGTQDIIKNFFEKQNIKGELHENSWRDFAYNRSIVCKLAQDKADYLITLDADEIFKYDDDFKISKLTCDAYYIMTRNGPIEYTRMQLVSNRLKWYYKDILHEYIHSDTKIESIDLLRGIYNHPSPDGARSADPNKYRKDALVLERGLLDEPDNIRYRFYLAQSYRDCNDYDNAIKNYKIRADAYGFDEEKIAGAMMGLPAIGGGTSLNDQILYSVLKSNPQFAHLQMPSKNTDPYDYYRKTQTQPSMTIPEGQPSNNGIDAIIAADGNVGAKPYAPQSTGRVQIDPNWPKGTDEKGNVFYQGPDGKVYDANGDVIPL